MNIESQRTLRLLDAVEQESTVTQRTLASRLGMALGLTNLYIKRLIHKGYIKCVSVRPNRLAYLITPRGLSEKARLTVEFMEHSLALYRGARGHLRQMLAGHIDRGTRVAIYGTGEAAELALLVLRELGLELEAVFDDDGRAQLFGLRSRRIDGHAGVRYDVLIVATLDGSTATVTRLLELGVAEDKLLPLTGKLKSAAPARRRMAKAHRERRPKTGDGRKTLDAKRR